MKEIKNIKIIVFLMMMVLLLPSCATNSRATSYKDLDTSSINKIEYMYVGSKNSDIYHKPSCEWAQKIHGENLIEFIDRVDANAYGYRACKVCKP